MGNGVRMWCQRPAASHGYSASKMSLMSGEGRKGRAVLLMAESSPVVPLGVGRAMLQFGGD
jgi:hypothetical protein